MDSMNSYGEEGYGGGGRGYGGGRGRGYGGRGGFRGTPENAKTKICRRWQDGHCAFGERCNFAHGEHELRSLPQQESGGGGRGGRGGYGGRGRGYGGGYGNTGGYNNWGGQGYEQAGFGVGGRGGPPQGYGGGGQYQQQPPTANQPAYGPNGWVMYIDAESGDPYFHHPDIPTTQWEQPAEWPNPPIPAPQQAQQ
ncbi:unnamed protein product [Pedinophyceae sp. YPF-701]|nr:unnamed protein product [Pedinophyceae sp. YPF-701]